MDKPTIETYKQEIITIARLTYEKGLSFSSTGNISVMLSDNSFLITSTKSALGFLTADDITHIDNSGMIISGRKASKEFLLHKSFYEILDDTKSIIHVHSPYITAISCLKGLNKENVFPPITPYLIMKFGNIPAISYHNPGETSIIHEIVETLTKFNSRALVIQNHGVIVSSKDTLKETFLDLEEIEASAKLYITVKNLDYNVLNEYHISKIFNKGA